MAAEFELWLEVKELMRRQEMAIDEMRRCGQELAAAERAYKVQLREEALRLKRGGMAVGMISLTVKGDPKVAELRERRDVAEAFYKAAQEAVLSYKLQARLVSEQLSREVGSPSFGIGS